MIDLVEAPDYQPPRLHMLAAKWIIECAPADVPPPNLNYPIVLDLESWDGSNLCVVWGAWLLAFVTDRFVDCLRRHANRNCRIMSGRGVRLRQLPLYCLYCFPLRGRGWWNRVVARLMLDWLIVWQFCLWSEQWISVHQPASFTYYGKTVNLSHKEAATGSWTLRTGPGGRGTRVASS
ncbi:MAG: hypothetical protein EPO21_19620 [Chloroflexota bacterium]|nr:MAG: hypothetical protein EPO21_19620 [Chloroflexota bacterium]